MKNAARGSNIILKQIPDLWVHTGVRQARCRTNKNTPESLRLNKLCARTRKLSLHGVVKAQCVSLARLERGGPEPGPLICLSNSASCISTAGTVTVSLIPSVRYRGHPCENRKDRERERRKEREVQWVRKRKSKTMALQNPGCPKATLVLQVLTVLSSL